MTLPSDVPPPEASDELATALTELVSIVLSTSAVEDLLDAVARLAGSAMSISDVACGITLVRNQGPFTVATSAPLAALVDEVQYDQGEGPCLEALRTGEVVDVVDLNRERRWGAYPLHALRHGVRSSLSVPLRVDEQARGAINLYSRAPHGFGADDRDRALMFATQAAAALTLVVRQARQSDVSDQLRSALASRSVIDQAIGILMAQQKCSAAVAFALLRTASQSRNVKLREVAVGIVRAVGGVDPEPAPFLEPV